MYSTGTRDQIFNLGPATGTTDALAELAAGFNVPAQVEVWNLGEKLTSTMTLPSQYLQFANRNNPQP